MFRILFISLLSLGLSAADALPKTATAGLFDETKKTYIFIDTRKTRRILQKVQDLPDIPALRRSDGIYVDLGYLHPRPRWSLPEHRPNLAYSFYGHGQWVGYLGSRYEFVPLTPAKLRRLLALSGLRQLPPVPEFPGNLREEESIALITGFFAVVCLTLARLWFFFFYQPAMRARARASINALSSDALYDVARTPDRRRRIPCQ